jgi:hypothetical protein
MSNRHFVDCCIGPLGSHWVSPPLASHPTVATPMQRSLVCFMLTTPASLLQQQWHNSQPLRPIASEHMRLKKRSVGFVWYKLVQPVSLEMRMATVAYACCVAHRRGTCGIHARLCQFGLRKYLIYCKSEQLNCWIESLNQSKYLINISCMHMIHLST